MLKKMNLSLLIAFSLAAPAIPPLPSGYPSAEARSQGRYQTIIVRNATELIAAIGPNRTIVLKPNTYNLDKKLNYKSTPYFGYDKSSDGPTIQNVHNLTLMGSDVRSTKIVISEEAPNVISFENSQNIRIESLEIGHVPQSTAICLGAVVAFYNSKHIQINDVNLFGSGTFGLWLENTHNLTLNNSIIKECSQGIVFLSRSKQVTLYNSTFVNNDGGINLWENSEILLQRIQMTHNSANKSRDYSKSLFNAKKNSKITVIDSKLTHNNAHSLAGEGKSAIHFWRNYMFGNSYKP